MSNTNIAVSFRIKIISMISVIIFCWIVARYSVISFFGSNIFLFQFSKIFPVFEQHFWQFIFSFLAIGILSRGHLWSYGITSKNLKTSMYWLGILYAGTIILTVLLHLLDADVYYPLEEVTHHQIRETILTMIVYWMSSPVANQILFFGLAQTVILKQWGDTVKIAGIPFVIIVPVILFITLSSSNTMLHGQHNIFFLTLLGCYCGVVYWKTGSLIAPIMGQAFYFGFPFVVQLIKYKY